MKWWGSGMDRKHETHCRRARRACWTAVAPRLHLPSSIMVGGRGAFKGARGICQPARKGTTPKWLVHLGWGSGRSELMAAVMAQFSGMSTLRHVPLSRPPPRRWPWKMGAPKNYCHFQRPTNVDSLKSHLIWPNSARFPLCDWAWSWSGQISMTTCVMCARMTSTLVGLKPWAHVKAPPTYTVPKNLTAEDV